MPAPPDSPPRAAVLGLGMMGRHHARVLQTSPRFAFAGAVDAAGDAHGAVHDPALVYPSLDALVATGAPDLAVVALPTEDHAATAVALARAGVHVLVEKPLAATVEAGREIIDACSAAGVHAAVGHVERFNPALIDLRRRLADGQLGEVFLVATERLGPFPDRVRDVGVVKDLATHDLDLVRWIADAPIASLAAETSHRLGREHEDLVAVTGRLDNGIVFNVQVDWVTPTKVRRTRVVGERGMLLANTLTADLTFVANGTVASEWAAARALRGVSEGDSTRYALARREPLLAELEAFCDLVEGDPAAPVVSLEHGLEAVAYAEAALESADRHETVTTRIAPA
jgi:predicted dehydrogenase